MIHALFIWFAPNLLQHVGDVVYVVRIRKASPYMVYMHAEIGDGFRFEKTLEHILLSVTTILWTRHGAEPRMSACRVAWGRGVYELSLQQCLDFSAQGTIRD